MRARWTGDARLLRAVATNGERLPDGTGLVLPAAPLAEAPEDPVLRLVLERALAGSRPATRSDGARVALAIEGGGMAGSVSGGMCAALEALGLIDSFDAIYGSSAGSINASYTAAGQAQLRALLYVVAAQAGVIDPHRALRGRPPFRLAELFDSLFHTHPHAPAVLADAPSLRLTAARVDDKQLDMLGSFESVGEMRTAVWASCAVPILAGDIVDFRGRRYVDGGLIESLPYGVALREGATHVLVLRSRPSGYRKQEYRGARRRLLDHLLRGAPETVVEMIYDRPGLYNAAAADLQAPARAGLAGRVTQIAPPDAARRTSQIEARPARLLESIATGVHTVYRALTAARQIEPACAARRTG